MGQLPATLEEDGHTGTWVKAAGELKTKRSVIKYQVAFNASVLPGLYQEEPAATLFRRKRENTENT